MQMYMLEGASRWNMGKGKEAVAVEGALSPQNIRCPIDVSPEQHEPAGPWLCSGSRVHPTWETYL